MGFSDKMRETLGSEGARVRVMADEGGWAGRVSPGGVAETEIQICGGTKTARVEALIVQVIVRHRHWSDGQGMTLTDAQANELDSRTHLTPSWSREQVGEARVTIEADVEAHAEHAVSVQVAVSEHCDHTSPACSITLLAQADIRGQIDPSATGKLLVAS